MYKNTPEDCEHWEYDSQHLDRFLRKCMGCGSVFESSYNHSFICGKCEMCGVWYVEYILEKVVNVITVSRKK